MVLNRADKEIISNATTNLKPDSNNLLYFTAAKVKIRKIRPKRAKSIAATMSGSERTMLFFLSCGAEWFLAVLMTLLRRSSHSIRK
jgi:hypothetical protein